MPMADPLEFAGCVYASPGDVDLRSRPDGTSYPFSLTKEQVLNMRFVDLPVCVEHATVNRKVGRVVDSAVDPRTGHAAVKFKFDDTAAGHAAARLVREGIARELSLHHQYFPDTERVKPVEVSVCFKGARKGSVIYKNKEFEELKMASSAAPPPQEMPAPPIAVAASDAQDPSPAEPAAPPADEPEASARTGNPLQDKIETIARNIPAEQQEDFFNFVGAIIQDANEQRAKNVQLRDVQKIMEENNKDVASQVVGVLADMFKAHVPELFAGYDELTTKKVTEELTNCPTFVQTFGRSIPVAASAIGHKITRSAGVAAAAEAAKNKACEQLNLYQNAGVVLPPGSPWAAPAREPVAVEASNAKRQRQEETPRTATPRWLADAIGNYPNEYTKHVMRKDDLPQNTYRGN